MSWICWLFWHWAPKRERLEGRNGCAFQCRFCNTMVLRAKP